MDTPVDNVLNQWRSYLTNISSNLMELTDQIEFQMIKLKANDTTNGYTGITKVKADQCVETAGRLWRYFALLSEVIDKADKLNTKRSFLSSNENAVKEFLDTTLIVMETERIGINQRNLLSGENSEKKVTAKELLKHMEESFEDLCRDITEISQASETVDKRLSNIKNEITKLNSTSKRLGLGNMPAFNTDKVTEIESDPLKGSAELDKLVYSVEKYRASLQSAEREYNKIVETLNGVREMLSELKDLTEKSKAAVVESGKVFGSMQNIRPVISQEVIKSLQDWAQVLEGKLSEGYLNAVKIGLAKLESECTLKLEMERANYEINSKDYNEWLDLKGQYRALQAKTDMLKTKGVLDDNSLNDLIVAVRTALYANPVNLDNCRQLVRKFELRLKG